MRGPIYRKYFISTQKQIKYLQCIGVKCKAIVFLLVFGFKILGHILPAKEDFSSNLQVWKASLYANLDFVITLPCLNIWQF